MKEEQLLKRSSSADRVGRERWLHHITEPSAANNGTADLLSLSLSTCRCHSGLSRSTSDQTTHRPAQSAATSVQSLQRHVQTVARHEIRH